MSLLAANNLLACFLPHCWRSQIISFTSSLHCGLSLANLEHSANDLFDQSLISSVHLCTGLPRLLFPSILPSSNLTCTLLLHLGKIYAILYLLSWWRLQRYRCECYHSSRVAAGQTRAVEFGFKNLKTSKAQLRFFILKKFLLGNLINRPHIQNKYNCFLSVSYITLYAQLK